MSNTFGAKAHANVLKGTFSTDCKSDCIRIGLRSSIHFFALVQWLAALLLLLLLLLLLNSVVRCCSIFFF